MCVISENQVHTGLCNTAHAVYIYIASWTITDMFFFT